MCVCCVLKKKEKKKKKKKKGVSGEVDFLTLCYELWNVNKSFALQ